MRFSTTESFLCLPGTMVPLVSRSLSELTESSHGIVESGLYLYLPRSVTSGSVLGPVTSEMKVGVGLSLGEGVTAARFLSLLTGGNSSL